MRDWYKQKEISVQAMGGGVLMKLTINNLFRFSNVPFFLMGGCDVVEMMEMMDMYL